MFLDHVIESGLSGSNRLLGTILLTRYRSSSIRYRSIRLDAFLPNSKIPLLSRDFIRPVGSNYDWHLFPYITLCHRVAFSPQESPPDDFAIIFHQFFFYLFAVRFDILKGIDRSARYFWHFYQPIFSFFFHLICQNKNKKNYKKFRTTVHRIRVVHTIRKTLLASSISKNFTLF